MKIWDGRKIMNCIIGCGRQDIGFVMTRISYPISIFGIRFLRWFARSMEMDIGSERR